MARRGSSTGVETTRVEVRPVDDSGVEMYATGEHRRDDRIVSTEMKVWWILVLLFVVFLVLLTVWKANHPEGSLAIALGW
jgi:hypothetical protein